MDKHKYQQTMKEVRDDMRKAILHLAQAKYALEQTADDNGYYPDDLGGLAHLVADADDKAVSAFRLADFSFASALCGE